MSLRTFLVLVAVQDFDYYQFDFKTAYLNARIPKGHYYFVEQPIGLPKVPNKVWKLRKALYSLRRSCQYWFKTLTPVMEKLGFVPFGSDTCLFQNKTTKALVILYVDDLLIATPTLSAIDSTKEQLMSAFEMKELGEVKRFLGFDVVRDRKNRTIFLS